MSEIIDAYAHIGLPRFVSAEEFLSMMDLNGVGRAIVAGADTCPDLVEVSRAAMNYKERFRAVGVPLGGSVAEMSDSIRHQAACGFLGIRIFDYMIAAHPTLLQMLGDLELVPYVVGSPGLEIAAELLVKFLEAGSDRLVVAPHFAGVPSSAVLEKAGPVKDLFDHPHFLVVFSRQGAYPDRAVRRWAEALLSRHGWEKSLFGSEFPVCLWRNESYARTLAWARNLDSQFPEAAQSKFYENNAHKSLWERPYPPPKIVDAKYSAEFWPMPETVPLFPSTCLDLTQVLHREIMARYLASNVESRPDYKTFVTNVFIDAVRTTIDQTIRSEKDD